MCSNGDRKVNRCPCLLSVGKNEPGGNSPLARSLNGNSILLDDKLEIVLCASNSMTRENRAKIPVLTLISIGPNPTANWKHCSVEWSGVFSSSVYKNFDRKLAAFIRILKLLLSWLKVERVTKKMSEDKKEYDLKMQEYAQLLDIRADRIRVTITRTHSLIKLFVFVVVCLFVSLFVCFLLVSLILQFTIMICSGETQKHYHQLKMARHGGYKYKVSSVFICLLSASEEL